MWHFITSPFGAVLTGLLVLPLAYVLIRWARSGHPPVLPAGTGGLLARNWARIQTNPWTAGIIGAAMAALIAIIAYPAVLTSAFWLQQPGGIPLLLWILVPLIAALVIWNLPRADQAELAVVILATVVFFTVLGLYLSDGLDIGLRKKALYIVAICTLAALVFYVGRPRLSWAFAIATFGILGISHLMSYSDMKAGYQYVLNRTGESWSEATKAGDERRRAADAKEASAAPKSTSDPVGCDRVIRSVAVGHSPREVNPGGHCALTYLVTEGTVKFTGPLVPVGQQTAGKQPNAALPGIMTHVVATTSLAKLDYQLCPPSHHSPGWCS